MFFFLFDRSGFFFWGGAVFWVFFCLFFRSSAALAANVLLDFALRCLFVFFLIYRCLFFFFYFYPFRVWGLYGAVPIVAVAVLFW